MRNLTQTSLVAVLSEETGVVFVTTLKIEHPDIPEPLRFVNNTEAVEVDGEEYIPAGFEIRLPTDTEDNVPLGQITLDNVDREIIRVVRGLKVAPKITLNVVRVAMSGQTLVGFVEVGPIEFKLSDFSYNADFIRGTIAYEEDFLNEGYPRLRFTPQNSPGMF